MAKNYDTVITAVHYDVDGKVEWVRAHLRRWGVVYGDAVILAREALLQQLKEGKKVAVGRRKRFFGNSFEIDFPLGATAGPNPLLRASGDERELEGAPLL